jgi:enoyl-CoA hydratase/carnithine racemase
MYILPRLVGQGRAMQMLLTGERIPAQEALQTGLVTRVVPQQQLMDAAIDMALQCFSSEDLVEGFNAFLEKPTPVYKGK